MADNSIIRHLENHCEQARKNGEFKESLQDEARMPKELAAIITEYSSIKLTPPPPVPRPKSDLKQGPKRGILKVSKPFQNIKFKRWKDDKNPSSEASSAEAGQVDQDKGRDDERM